MNRFCPYQSTLGHTVVWEPLPELWSRVRVLRHTIPRCVQGIFVCTTASQVLQTLKYPQQLHSGLEPITPSIPHQYEPVCRQFSLLRHGSSFNTGPSEATMYQKYYAKHV